MTSTITEEIIDKIFQNINKLEPKHDWDLMLRNAYDSLAIAKLDISMQELEDELLRSNYKWDKETQLYIKKDNTK